jgi:hypothetical protein
MYSIEGRKEGERKEKGRKEGRKDGRRKKKNTLVLHSLTKYACPSAMALSTFKHMTTAQAIEFIVTDKKSNRWEEMWAPLHVATSPNRYA